MTVSQRDRARRRLRLGIWGAATRAYDAAGYSADGHLDEDVRGVVAADHVDAGSDEGDAEAEGEVGADDLGGGEVGHAEQGYGTESACAGGGEADLRADGEHDGADEFGAVAAGAGDAGGAEVAEDVPAGGEEDDGSEDEVEDGARAVGGDVLEEDGADDDAGKAAEEHEAEDAVVDLTARDLHGDDDELDDGGVGERGADGDLDRDVQEEDEQGRGDDAGAYAG